MKRTVLRKHFCFYTKARFRAHLAPTSLSASNADLEFCPNRANFVAANTRPSIPSLPRIPFFSLPFPTPCGSPSVRLAERDTLSRTNMSYYDNSQWPAGAGQAGWEHQTPPARSGLLVPIFFSWLLRKRHLAVMLTRFFFFHPRRQFGHSTRRPCRLYPPA